MRRTIEINRAPVLTLWATVVAERLGFNRNEALTLGPAWRPRRACFQRSPKGVRSAIEITQ
jgi:hypothetical protein